MNFSKTLLAIAGLSLLASCGTEASPTTTTTTTSTPTSATTVTTSGATDTTTTVKTNDETATTTTTTSEGHSYNSVVDYKSPGGHNSVRFVVDTDANGIIKTLSASVMEADKISAGFVEKFNSAAQNSIVGKKVSEIANISAIGGRIFNNICI